LTFLRNWKLGDIAKLENAVTAIKLNLGKKSELPATRVVGHKSKTRPCTIMRATKNITKKFRYKPYFEK